MKDKRVKIFLRDQKIAESEDLTEKAKGEIFTNLFRLSRGQDLISMDEKTETAFESLESVQEIRGVKA